MSKAAHQCAGFDGIGEILLAFLLARIETVAQIDVEPGRNRALSLVKDRLEIFAHDKMGKKLRASEIVGILLLEKDDRIAVENETYLAIVFRRLRTEIVGSLIEAAGMEGANRPVHHEENAGLPGEPY